jgi:O-antigen ligase
MLPDDRNSHTAHQAAPRGVERAARGVIKAAFGVCAAFTSSTFNPELLPPDYAFVPQVVALGLWLIIIGASAFAPRVRSLSLGTDFILILAFYGWAVCSVAWSDWSVSSALKSVALLITTFGSFRLATTLPIHDIIGSVAGGLFLLLLASLAVVVLLPEVGIDQSWMHGGQWQGVFESKQSLGFLASFAAFFALYLRLTGGSWLTFLLFFGLAVTTLAGSGSRGSAAVALMSCCALLLCRASKTFVQALAIVPVVCICVAFALILYLYVTELDHFPIFGTKVDLTERTFIWHYGIARLDDRLFAGYGLDGFWSDERMQGFREVHGWVLDNFHSGYLTILAECGVVGFTLFLLLAVFFAVRVVGLSINRALPAPQCAVIACFVALSFQTNLTETMFLRSTSLMAILFVVFLFLSCHPMHRSERTLQAFGR